MKRSMLTLSRWSEIHVTYPLSVINNNVSCRWTNVSFVLLCWTRSYILTLIFLFFLYN
jgi:hypothetical protein